MTDHIFRQSRLFWAVQLAVAAIEAGLLLDVFFVSVENALIIMMQMAVADLVFAVVVGHSRPTFFYLIPAGVERGRCP